MRTIELARKIADYYGMPVKIITAKRNPTPAKPIYRQTDHNLILRADTIQKLPIEERRKIARQIASTASGTGGGDKQPSMTVDDIKKLPKKERIALAKKLISQDWVLREIKQTTIGGIPVSKVEPEKRKEDHGLPDTMRVELRKFRKPPMAKIGGPNDVAQFMRHVADYDRESAKILHLDTKNQIVGVENVSTGSLNASIVHPREAVKGAILNNSNAVIFVHNHPSGNPEPSIEDMNIHKKLKEAFGTVGIDLLDSMIIGKDGHISLRERGL